MILSPSRLEEMFSPEVRERGRLYQADRRVKDFLWRPDGVRATVLGSQPYQVEIVWGEDEGSELRLSCSCPLSDDKGSCKHVWAAVLEAGRRGALGPSALRSPSTFGGALHDPLDQEQAHALNSGAQPEAGTAGDRSLDATESVGRSRPSPGRSASSPSWLRHFDRLDEAAARFDTRRPSSGVPVASAVRFRLAPEGDQFVTERLLVDLEWRQELKSGGWGRWKSLMINESRLSEISDAEERELVEHLLQSVRVGERPSEWASWKSSSTFELAPLFFDAILRRLCATGRSPAGGASLDLESRGPQVHHDAVAPTWIGRSSGPNLTEPDGPLARYQPATTYEFELRAWEIPATESTPPSWRVSGFLVTETAPHEDPDSGNAEATTEPSSRQQLELGVADLLWVHAGGLMATRDGLLLPCRFTSADVEWLSVLHDEGDLEAPLSQTDQLMEALYGVALPARCRLPPQLTVRETLGVPEPILRLQIESDDSSPGGRRRLSRDPAQRVSLVSSFDYGGRSIQPDDDQPGWMIELGHQLVRDVAREAEYTRELRQVVNGLARLAYPPVWRSLGRASLLPDQAAVAVRILIGELSTSWRVILDGKPVHQVVRPVFSIQGGLDWFELDREVTLETSAGNSSIALPTLLRAARGDGTVEMAGGVALLGADVSERLRALGAFLVRAKRSGGDGLRLAKSHLLVLDALLGGEDDRQIRLRLDQTCERLRRSLETFEGIEARTEPAGFHGELRDYQRLGLGWLEFLRSQGLGGCLADDMGLGKTVQVLALLQDVLERDEGDPRPFLVVAPKSVVPNWISEARRFAPELEVVDFTGPQRRAHLARLAQSSTRALVVTTYNRLRIDLHELLTLEFDTVILDEAQAIKNPASKTAIAARRLLCSHRLALTGTPVENHLGDAVSIFQFLNPGMVENLPALRALAHPKDPAASLTLASAALRPLILRRTKEAVLTELPAKTEQTIFCELSGRERRNYDELAAYYRARLLEPDHSAGALPKNRMVALEALLRLRQAACHQGLLGRGTKSSKLDLLDELIEELLGDPEHKALVFSQFTSLLAFVRKRFDARGWRYAYLDGSTQHRDRVVRDFQEDPECRLFLISLKAGGLGLNLTAADYVFLLDPWWNPAVERQAVDRAHRIGQSKPVMAYRLLARDTVEERVAELQSRKRELADLLLGSEKSLIGEMTAEDLQVLLS